MTTEPEDDELEDLDLEDEDDDDAADDDDDDDDDDAPPPEPAKSRAPKASAEPAQQAPKKRAPRAPRERSIAPPDPFTTPELGAFYTVQRYGLSGALERCRLFIPQRGLWLDKFAPPVSDGQLLELWGSGRYKLTWFDEQGKLVATPSPIELELPTHPRKPNDARPEPPPEPPPPPVPPQPVQAVPAKVRPELPTGLPTDVLSWIQWQEYHRTVAREEMEERFRREREEHQHMLERLRAESDRAIAQEEARHRRAMEEQEARSRRDREHITSLTRDLLDASKASQDIAPLADKLEELEERIESGGEAGQAIKAALPVIMTTLGEVLMNRTKAKPPIEGGPTGGT